MNKKIAHYWYSDGYEITIYANDRRIFVVDGKDGGTPFSKHLGHSEEYPDNGTELADYSYETIGLFYDYEMRETGWSGDC